MEVSRNKIYKVVKDYYDGKGLSSSEFSNRLRAVNMLVEKEYPMSEAVYWLFMYENNFDLLAADRNRVKARYRNQLKIILKRIGFVSTKEGLKSV